MNLLAIDSASSSLSIAVHANGELYIDEKDARTSHIEYVMDMIDQLVKKASINARKLDGIVCMGGPGSFSGLRIGFSVAKGLSLALGIPFAPIPSLDCIVKPYSNADFTIPVIQAHKNAYFFAFYRQGKIESPVYDEEIKNINELFENNTFDVKNIVLTGPGADTLYQSISLKAQSRISSVFTKKGYSKELIEIANENKIFDNVNNTWYFQGPDYYRKTDAEKQLAKNTGT
jgi:tRNA threonylcarbamoyladenosine biosynthesis protein TsaB